MLEKKKKRQQLRKPIEKLKALRTKETWNRAGITQLSTPSTKEKSCDFMGTKMRYP